MSRHLRVLRDSGLVQDELVGRQRFSVLDAERFTELVEWLAQFRAPAEDVWASITESERTARWFGPWEGHAAPGKTIKVQMAFEDQAPWCELHIEACETPHRLAVSMVDEAGTWRMELLLSDVDGATELRLVHHLDTTDGIGQIGPGWEYYLDMLMAARDDSPKPAFDDYYPAMKPYFDELSIPD